MRFGFRFRVCRGGVSWVFRFRGSGGFSFCAYDFEGCFDYSCLIFEFFSVNFIFGLAGFLNILWFRPWVFAVRVGLLVCVYLLGPVC